MKMRNPIQHRMTRRSAAHDYTRPGLYHITMHVAETLGQPFGAVVGSLDALNVSADAPRTALTRVGQMVEHELLTAIHDNGFSDRYHPSEERLGLCAEGRLLLVTPWVYQYRGKEEQ